MIEPKTIQKFTLEKGQKVVLKKYIVRQKIGEGTNCIVYAIIHEKSITKKVRAIKVENIKTKTPQISLEISVIQKIFEVHKDIIGFPSIYEFGSTSQYNYLVLGLLGPNLQQLLKACSKKFTLNTTILIGLQILDRIEVLHNLGYLYQDIRPDNFLVGLGDDSVYIYMVDFGKCSLFRNKKNGLHIPYKQNVNNNGDTIFMSLNGHQGIHFSRRDDIQSLLYMLIYFLNGTLPWLNLEGKTKKQLDLRIYQKKKRYHPQKLTANLPFQFSDLLWYVRSIDFYQKPDYDFIREKLYCLLDENFDGSKIIYDWNKKQDIDFQLSNLNPRIIVKNIQENADNSLMGVQKNKNELVPQIEKDKRTVSIKFQDNESDDE